MSIPAHKVVGDIGKPGQRANPINSDLMDDMGHYAVPEPSLRTTWNKETTEERLRRYEALLRDNHIPF